MVVFEIKFGQVAVQMGFRNAVEVTVNPALHDGEKRLNRVCVCKAAMPHVFIRRMVDGSVAGRFFPGLGETGASSVIKYDLRSTCVTIALRSVFAVTSATWRERTLPSRSTSENTAIFFGSGP